MARRLQPVRGRPSALKALRGDDRKFTDADDQADFDDRTLDFDPMIPSELVDVVMEGFRFEPPSLALPEPARKPETAGKPKSAADRGARLAEEHEALKSAGCRNPTEVLAKQEGVTPERVRQLMRGAAKPQQSSDSTPSNSPFGLRREIKR